MVTPIPIHCHKCGTVVVSDMQTLTGYVIQPPGISCMSCGEMIIAATQVICSVEPSATEVIMAIASTTFTG